MKRSIIRICCNTLHEANAREFFCGFQGSLLQSLPALIPHTHLLLYIKEADWLGNPLEFYELKPEGHSIFFSFAIILKDQSKQKEAVGTRPPVYWQVDILHSHPKIMHQNKITVINSDKKTKT